MKKLALLFLLAVSNLVLSQYRYDEKYFVGENLDLLVGKKLVTLPIEDELKQFGYDNFYNSPELKMRERYKSKDGYSKSKYEDIYNKTFILQSYSKVSNIFGDYILVLKDEEGNNAYFLYNSKKAYTFPFKVDGDFKIPTETYCSKLDVRKDKFSKKIVKYSPLLEPVSFTKDGAIYLTLRAYGHTPVVNGSNAIILLDNGQKISKKTKVDVEANEKGYEYSVFIPLTQADISTLTKHSITDYKLDIFEGNISNGEVYKEYLKCIIK